MEDLVYRATVAAARRLLKTRLRLYISRLKASEASGDVWKPLVQLEEGFHDEAQQAWSQIKTCWALGTPSPAAGAMLDVAVRVATFTAASRL